MQGVFMINSSADVMTLDETFVVNRPDLCRKYAALIDALPIHLVSGELGDHAAFLSDYPFIEAFRSLKDSAPSKSRVTGADAMSRIEANIGGENRRVIEKCMSQGMQQGFHFSRVPRGSDYRNVLEMMNAIPNCIKPEQKQSVAENIQADIDNGACIKLFGIDGQGGPRSYFRYYISLDRGGSPVLQIDAVEAGTKSFWTKVEQWMQAGRGKELFMGVSTGAYMADALGINHLVLGDFESDEIGRMIGCPRVKVYGRDVSGRKIGLPPLTTDAEGRIVSNGAFVNRLGEDSRQRVLHVTHRLFVTEWLQGAPMRLDYVHGGLPGKSREVALYNQVASRLHHYR